MKKHELIFGFLKAPVEFGIVFAAFFAAWKIRLVTDLIPGIQLPIQRISETTLWYFALFGAVLYVVLAALRGLYRIRFSDTGGAEVLRVISLSGAWFLYYIAMIYLSVGYVYQTEIPRLIIFFALILTTLGVVVFRVGLSFLQDQLLEHWVLDKTRLVILSALGEDTSLFGAIRDNAAYELLGFGNGKPTSTRYIGGIDAVITLIREHAVDEILSLDSGFTREELSQISEYARIYGVTYRYADRFFLSESHRAEVSFMEGTPVMEVCAIGLGPWGRIVKRTFDIVVSFLLLLMLLPFLLIVSIVVFISDRHAPIYRSMRVGRNGVLFPMYKFRSMRVDADAMRKKLISKNERTGPLFKMENDPRITPLGKWLRRFDIDELPQLFNVLVGDMSLIGPRPHLSDEVSKYEESQKRVLTLKPGITGMAQVNGRHKNSFEDEVRFDVFYIENWTLFLDFLILVKTALVVLARQGR